MCLLHHLSLINAWPLENKTRQGCLHPGAADFPSIELSCVAACYDAFLTNRSALNLIWLCGIFYCAFGSRHQWRSIEGPSHITPVSSSVLRVSLSCLPYRLAVRLVTQSHTGLKRFNPRIVCMLDYKCRQPFANYTQLVQWDMPINHSARSNDWEHSGHGERAEHPLYLCLSISVSHWNICPVCSSSPPFKTKNMRNLK